MNTGEKIQVRRFDGVDHWLYAVVENGAINQVRITHPGNPEDGKELIVTTSDIRTKADVQTVLTSAQAIVANVGPKGLTAAQLKQLATLDGFWANFLPPADGRLTEHQSKHLSSQQATLHTRVVKHYQEQLKQL